MIHCNRLKPTPLSLTGYNLGNEFARFLALQGHLMNGNPLTNLISIGMHTKLTGPDPPAPAKVGGLTFHGTFEGINQH